MAIPDYQALMRPTLQVLADGQEHSTRAIYDLAAASEGITDAEREQLIPSGSQSMFNNRVRLGPELLGEGRSDRPPTAGGGVDHGSRPEGA